MTAMCASAPSSPAAPAGGRAWTNATLVLEGQTLLARDLAFLHGLFPKVAVVVGRGQQLDLGDDTTVDVLEDAWPGSSALVGIATALAHYRQPVFAMAADVAFPHREAALAVLAAAPGHDASLPAIGRDWRQPLFAVYGPRCLAPMAALLSSDRHRIVDALAGASVAEVRVPDDSVFHNINTMDDYREARRRAPFGGAPPRPPRCRRHRREARRRQDGAHREACG